MSYITKAKQYGGLVLGFFLAIVLVTLTSAAPKQQIVEVPVKVEVIKYVPVKIDANDEQQIRCLADNAYFEARGEPRAGQIAVTNVVMNRVEDRRWPGTACGVVKQKARGVCQFSWVCNKNRRVVDRAAFNKVEVIAEAVYLKNIKDNTNGAKFFHASHVRPSWARVFQVTRKIGSHIFYRG